MDVVVFIVFAFYAIRMFLGIQDAAKIAKFKEKLQDDVDTLWKSPQGSQKVSYSLPGKIDKICFETPEREYEGNLVLKPEEAVPDLGSMNIKHIYFVEGVCFENENGKVTMLLKKDYGEELVIIKEVE